MNLRYHLLFCSVLGLSITLMGQDSLNFGGVYQLPGVEVQATYRPVSPLAQRFTIEEVYRLPGTFYDPARLVALLPGVLQVNDQANHLSVRGNSPNRNQWRLNGLAIVNPNHTSNAGTYYDFPTINGGGVNAISAQVLNNSGFYPASLPAEYGGGTGGTFDLQLRPGSKSRHKKQVQAGFIGFDLAAEGPIGKSKKLSYLINGRYSFTGLLADAGVDFGGEEIRFGDLNAHLHYATDKHEASLFTIMGASSNIFDSADPTESELEEEKELFDIDFTDDYALLGGNYRYQGATWELALSGAYSRQSPERSQALRGIVTPFADAEIAYGLTTGRAVFTTKQYAITPYLGLEVLHHDAEARLNIGQQGSTMPTIRRSRSISQTIINPFAGLNYAWSDFTLHAGLRISPYTQTYGDQNTTVIEPRVALNYAAGRGTFKLALNRSSQLAIAPALVSGEQAVNEGPYAVINNEYSLGYERNFGQIAARITGFYESSPEEPAAMADGFLYSSSNSLELAPSLVFDTTAHTRRYGVEMELAGGRRTQGLYYRGNLTLLNAETEQPDGTFSPNRYAVDYAAKLTLGREWTRADKKQRQRTLGVNLALLLQGGERYGEIVANNPAGDSSPSYLQRPSYRNGFSQQLGTYFRPDLRLYKTKVRNRTTTTLALDLQNVAAISNPGVPYYDDLLGRAVEREQLSLIPVLSYRIVWR